MRQDIREGVVWYIMHNIDPNFSAMSRQFNCDYRTVKAAYLEGINQSNEGPAKPKTSRPSLLDLFKPKIDEKIDIQCSAKSIFKLIKKQGYTGSYSTVKQYCQKKKKEKIQKATIRKQNTLFDYLNDAFYSTGGVPEEILFDNMRTVLDWSKTQFTKVVFNDRFYTFSKDAGFHPIACRPFRPQIKGEVEALARTVEQLRVYHHEFDDTVELIGIVNDYCADLNEEISQATHRIPNEM